MNGSLLSLSQSSNPIPLAVVFAGSSSTAMATRRRQTPTSSDDYQLHSTNSSSSTTIAAQAIRASSAARRESSLYSAYAFDHRSPSSLSSATTSAATSSSFPAKDQKPYEYTSIKPSHESKQGFWGSLARKAKSIIEDDDPQQLDSDSRISHTRVSSNLKNADSSQDNHQKTENRTIHKGLNAISSSLNYIGNAVEEGLTKVENRTAGNIQETRKHIRKKPFSSVSVQNQTNMQPQQQVDQDLQLKASHDVAMAMAAKAKLLLRELKTVKADLAFAKERCAQLEEENKILREHRERGDNPEDDDLIRLQLETLLSEKARLAHENSVYARENRFLREVVEYHQLTMQDVVYFDQATEEVTEVYPIKVVSNPSDALDASTRDIGPYPVPPPGILQHPQS